MNVYDIAMDFVLLDAFNDLDNPPSTIVAVLQNRWITDGMKQSVRLEVWGITELFFPLPTIPSCFSIPFLLSVSSLFSSLLLSPSSLLPPSTLLPPSSFSPFPPFPLSPSLSLLSSPSSLLAQGTLSCNMVPTEGQEKHVEGKLMQNSC